MFYLVDYKKPLLRGAFLCGFIKVNRKVISQLHQKPVKVPFSVQQAAVFP